QVTAQNSVGWAGGWSATSSPVSTTAPVATVPGAPTALTSTSATATSITLSWTPPVNNGGAPITRYSVRRSTDSGLTWLTPSTNTPIGSPATTLTVAALTPGTSYVFQVTAQNSVGWAGGWSATSSP